MREIIKHRGAKYKLTQGEVNEIINFIISGEIDFLSISKMYGVQELMIKNIFNGKDRFKYLLGTERYFKMHETAKSQGIPTPKKRRSYTKGLTGLTQIDLDTLYTRLHNGESGLELSKEYSINQSSLSKFKRNTLTRVKGHIIELDKSNQPMEQVELVSIKDELLELAKQTIKSKKITIINVLEKELDIVCKNRLKKLLLEADKGYLELALNNSYIDNMQTGLLLFEVFQLISNYDLFEIGTFIENIKEKNYEL